MKTDIFNLQIISIKDILVHEEFDKKRTFPLVDNLKKRQELDNPILITSLGNNKYLQLDGMNRLSAFKELGFQSILTQIIDYNDQDNVELSSWIHLFKASEKELLSHFKKIPGLVIQTGSMLNIGHRYIKESDYGRLCTLILSSGKVFLIYSSGNLGDKVEKLKKIVTLYKDNITRDILPPSPDKNDINILFKQHDVDNAIIVFPTFTRHQIIDAVMLGKLFPAGITRHIIKRRCLNVGVPLSLFLDKSLVKQNTELEHLLNEKHFRVYEESTVLFE